MLSGHSSHQNELHVQLILLLAKQWNSCCKNSYILVAKRQIQCNCSILVIFSLLRVMLYILDLTVS